MLGGSQSRRHLSRPLHFHCVTLSVCNGEEMQRVPVAARDGRRNRGVQPATGKNDRSFWSVPNHGRERCRGRGKEKFLDLVAFFFAFDFLQQLRTRLAFHTQLGEGDRLETLLADLDPTFGANSVRSLV